MNKIGQTARSLLTVVLSVILILTLLSGCGEEVSEKNGLSMENISFRDIPGITEDEISAVEALRERYSAFTYGMLVSTEAFPNQDDEIRGYTALLCEWLTELFGIHFVPKLYSWDGLLEGLGSGAIDFTGELTANRERRESYYMTDAIAGRMVDYYRIAGSAPLSEIAASRPPRYVFFESTTTINDVLSSFDDDTSYETFFVRDFDRVYSMLKSGEADAFFSEENNIAAFDEYGDVVGRHFFPPIISPVSMSTQNSELRPIIDLVQKVLQNGGSTFLVELYNRGKSEYLQHTLFRKLTEEERNYINHNPVIYYVTQYNNYPMSFYNGHIKQWQGIAFELLSKIEALTGFTFRLAHDDVFISWPYLLAMVEYGQAAFVTELIRTKERVGRFIWLDTTLATEFLTLVSPSEQRSFGLSEIKNLTIGVIRNTAQTETFNRWFPNHEKTVEYDDTKEAFLAMRRGDVDLVMTSTSNLLVMTNYLELTGFKANIIFDDTVQESTFGFGTDEDILRSIIDKALGLINTKAISDDWKNRTFDHRYKLIEAQRPWLIGAIVLSLIILGLLSVLFIRSRYAGKRLEKLVKIRTEELELQTSTLNTMIDSLPDIVFCKDLNTNYTRYNKVMADYFGVCDKTLVGKGDVDGLGFPVDLVEQIHTVDRTIMRENKQMVFEEWVPSRDGSLRLFETIKAPLTQNGVVVGLIGISRDITARKAMEEEALAASRSKSTFLANMSHEIRTPMNSIMGFAEIAMDSNSVPQIKNHLRKIINSVKWLLRIINDILDISKIESGKIELEHIPFDLRGAISRCQSVILPDIKEKGLELRLYVEPLAGKTLLGDPVRLYQILVNLLSNAVKFTSKGAIDFTSTVKEMKNGSATIYFEVKDSGIGMNSEQVKKIFEPFMQADSSTTRNYGGTGLGLAIVKNIIELMGGKLAVESVPDAGTTFSFEITFETVDAVSDISNDYHLIEKPYFEDVLILICDDNPMNQQVACEHLALVGIKTEVADNGKEGVEIIQERMRKGEKPFDLIFMDIFMPVMDGVEAATKITALDTGTPIVAMTANVMVCELENYKKHGMPDFLGKPFTSQELWRTLLKFLKPVSSSVVGKDEQARDKDELLKKLLINFAKNNQNLYVDIIDAIAAGDIQLAHRLAHTLKGNAGQIGKFGLQNIAAEIEELFRDGALSVPEGKLKILETELTLVLEELCPLSDEHAAMGRSELLNTEQIAALFEKIESMLVNINPEVVNLLDDIRVIPGTEELVRHIENFNFESAALVLAELKPEGETA